MLLSKIKITFLLFFFMVSSLMAQMQTKQLHFLEQPDSLHKGRFWITVGTGTAIYTGVSIILWNSWYKSYPIGKFHTFNDWGEWEDMDKVGHFVTAYNESRYGFAGALWTGMERRKALWAGAALGMGLQLTVEVMDGFSENWGWSWGDIGLNTAGIGALVAQELLWEEQRILMKISSTQPTYSTDPIFSVDGGKTTSLKERADELYGTTAGQVFFKDYNAQTLWMSANIWSFLPDRKQSKFPKWLNVAVGYGANNMFGGFKNEWQLEGAEYLLDGNKYPRYRQFYLSFDVDLSKIKTKSRWVKFWLGFFNWVKIPAPTLEINTLGEVKFLPIYW